MSFIQFFRILWARRAIILLSTLGCFSAAFSVAMIMPSKYQARSRVMLDIVKPDPVTGQMLSSQFARAYVKTQTELISDYRVAGKVVDALGWTTNPIFAAQYAERSASDHRDFRRWLAQRVIDNTDAALIEGSNILEITYTAGSSNAARKGADALREAYIQQTLAFKREDAAHNALWFHRQAKKLSEQLTAAEDRKNAFERANGIVLQDDNSDTDMVRLKALASSSASAPATVTRATAPSATQLAQIDAQIATASTMYGPNHPELLNLQRQRAAVSAAVTRELASAAGKQSGPSIASQLSSQTGKVLAQRGKVDDAQRLMSDVTVLREQYNKTAAKAAELDQQAQSTETGITVLGAAVAPESPSFPNIPLVVIGSLGLGMALGIAMTILVELLSRRVRGVEDIAMPDIPVIGVMPRTQNGSRSIVEWFGLRRPTPRAAH